MDCLITNSDRKIYIKLDSCGKAVTCVKHAAQKFSDKKAKNILSSLPKTLKKFNFMIVPIQDETQTDIATKCEIKAVADKKIIKNDDYVVPDTVTNWVQRFKSINGLVVDATVRKNELFEQLSNVDKELSNCLHEIELTRSKNACDGYKEYKKVKTVLEKRRVIKDELAVVQSISSYDINSTQIDDVVNRLKNRDFTMREVDDYTI